MSANGQTFTIDDAFELGPDDGEGGNRFGNLSFDRRSNLAKCETTEQIERESSLKYQNLENDDCSQSSRNPVNSAFKIRSDLGRCSTQSSRWSFSNSSNTTQRSYHQCFSWTTHPLIRKNKKMVVACFVLLIVGLVLILVGVALQVNPSSGVSSAIFYVPGFLLLIPGVYHVIFIYCALKGKTGYRFFYLPYFDK